MKKQISSTDSIENNVWAIIVYCNLSTGSPIVPITSLKKNRFIKVHIKLSKPGVKRIIRITVNTDLIINVEDA